MEGAAHDGGPPPQDGWIEPEWNDFAACRTVLAAPGTRGGYQPPGGELAFQLRSRFNVGILTARLGVAGERSREARDGKQRRYHNRRQEPRKRGHFSVYPSGWLCRIPGSLTHHFAPQAYHCRPPSTRQFAWTVWRPGVNSAKKSLPPVARRFFTRRGSRRFVRSCNLR